MVSLSTGIATMSKRQTCFESLPHQCSPSATNELCKPGIKHQIEEVYPA